MMTAINGLIVRTPSSVSSTGTTNSASIRSDGSVVFSNCLTLSLNDVFSSTYDNYLIVCRHTFETAGSGNIQGRLRVSGSDASGSNYVNTRLDVDSTTISATDVTAAEFEINFGTNTLRSGFTLYVYGPNLTSPTAFRSTTVSGSNSARIYDCAATHSLSTSYTGITFRQPSSLTFGGLLTVFAFNQ